MPREEFAACSSYRDHVNMPTGSCAECGFAWDVSYDEAVGIVGASPRWFAKAFDGGQFLEPPAGVWSAKGYVWHVVDMLRIGTERLWMLRLDPTRGIAPWDPDTMAEQRSYEKLSAPVGLLSLEGAARDWLAAARGAPRDIRAAHPLFGTMDAALIATFAAHEVVHHTLDVRRQLPTP
ncbi:MAG: hypothetical protein QOC60_702 [Frankiaceae bacterium]|jgi:hypothetical protein|nr:hypothetical protein [Frankiaceae bacterium]